MCPHSLKQHRGCFSAKQRESPPVAGCGWAFLLELTVREEQYLLVFLPLALPPRLSAQLASSCLHTPTNIDSDGRNPLCQCSWGAMLTGFHRETQARYPGHRNDLRRGPEVVMSMAMEQGGVISATEPYRTFPLLCTCSFFPGALASRPPLPSGLPMAP